MAIFVPPEAHWRDSARPARFFGVDYRTLFPLLFWLFVPSMTTFVIAILAVAFFFGLERYGFTLMVFLRWTRATLAGKMRIAYPWWFKERRR